MALTEVLTSSIKYKAARAAGRDADHHGFVGRALLLGQQLVAVIDIARDDLGLAGATHALAAAVVGAEARLNECVEQGHTGRHLCWRRFKIDHLFRLNFDQGSKAGFSRPGC